MIDSSKNVDLHEIVFVKCVFGDCQLGRGGSLSHVALKVAEKYARVCDCRKGVQAMSRSESWQLLSLPCVLWFQSQEGFSGTFKDDQVGL